MSLVLSLQDSDDGLVLFPSHPLHQLDARHQIACTAGSEEQTVMLDKIARHCDSFCIRYPETCRGI